MKWPKIPRGKRDWDRNIRDVDSCYAIRDSKLVLRGTSNTHLSGDTAKFLTGGVYSRGKAGFGFGKLEIGAKLNGTGGVWPAFWMLPENATWTSGGEIDIMERLNFDSIFCSI